jgi:3-deoxy-manno-octulosonate cytidylyltransferase (CMP-KDO synthetase)
MVHPEMVEEAVFPMLAGDDRIICVNLAARIGSEKEFEDRNTIKVVSDLEGFALYMSREAIPTRRIAGFAGINVFKQVCIIPFTARGLKNFSELPPTPLEKAESIDMLRFLEHGLRVKMVETCFSTHAVDTPADLAFVQELLRSDSLTAEYLRK